ncbi:hypothetical protein BDN72DRAFT_230264 [Pluteus cervinus]|uniref:Uncharacterized protein n=1 Tax=Pluteus cervinus TaxID=181527 RepID=A0ACD3BE65_9AGAR|nr:hypothetical protein BDN72DRAFT_230264 [Pluteus cervinus]
MDSSTQDDLQLLPVPVVVPVQVQDIPLYSNPAPIEDAMTSVFLPQQPPQPPQRLPTQSIRAVPPSFIPNFPPPINPFLLEPPLPSPSLHPPSSSYSSIVPSLDAALDPSTAAVAAATAANPQQSLVTSMTPLPLSAPFATPSTAPPLSMVFPPTDPPEVAALAPAIDQPPIESAEAHILLGEMLKDIAKTASSAGDACRLHHDAEATSKVDELKERITKVAEMISMMSLARPRESFPMPNYLVDYSVADALVSYATQTAPPMDILATLDSSRKRGATGFEEPRTHKALKREPAEDPTLPATVTATATVDQPMPSDPTPLYTTTVAPMATQATRAIAPLPHSRPSSRPPSPPTAFNTFTQNTQPANLITYYPEYGQLPTPLPTTSPTFSAIQPSWTDSVVPSRHHHSLSTGSLKGPIQGLSILPTPPLSSAGLEAYSPPLHQMTPPLPTPPASTAISPPLGRMSRSGSISGSFNNPFSYPFHPFSDTSAPYPGMTRVPATATLPASPSANWYPETTSQSAGVAPSEVSATTRTTPSDEEDDDDDADSEEGPSGSPKDHSSSSEGTTSSSSSAPNASSSSDVPQEYRAEVDRIFFEYLNKICSNLEATDSKGEPIHQTLMAKKMQRLDESPDFRPFKFRIQAFTLAFLEELARQGYPEEKIPMKKVRNYLWRQQYILRFNEDGKKAKSKGNHIWNIEAKKSGDGRWEFRPFHRKLAGSPPSVAYCGLRWSWTPRIWDPQASWQNVPVHYSSPSLPSWLSWKDDLLSGVPPPDAESSDITVIAKYVLDGQEGQLSHSFHLTIAPMTTLDSSSYTHSRRPSLASDPPKRSTSDSALYQSVPRSKSRSVPVPPVGHTTESPDTRVIRVLQSVAQRVTEETESQFVSYSPKQGELQDLVKQKHVLEQTVNAYDKEISGCGHSQTRRLAVAAQNVVVQAAHAVIADKTAAIGGVPPPQKEPVAAIESVTVNELSDATQDAIAEAVKRNGTASTEVDIIVAATSILKARTPGSPHPILETSTPSVLAPRSHVVPTSAMPTRMMTAPSTVFTTPLPTLSEYA